MSVKVAVETKLTIEFHIRAQVENAKKSDDIISIMETYETQYNDYPDLWKFTGHKLKKMKNVEMALNCYSKYFHITNDVSGIWFKATLLQRLRKHSEAISQYEYIIDKHPESYFIELCYLYVSDCYAICGRKGDAIKYLTALKQLIGEEGFVSLVAYCGRKISAKDLWQNLKQ